MRRYAYALVSATVLVALANAESESSKRTRVMDTSQKWHDVTYYIVGKPLVVMRTNGKDPDDTRYVHLRGATHE